MDPFTIASGAVGLFSGIAGLFGAGRANNRLEQLIGQDPRYRANPIAGQRLDLAQTLLNARMPGAQSVERNIYGKQANQLSAP